MSQIRLVKICLYVIIKVFYFESASFLYVASVHHVVDYTYIIILQETHREAYTAKV